MAIPQLRFKADDGTDFPLWQQKRFGDIMTCYSGGTPLASVKSYYGGTIPFLKSGEIHLDKTSSTLTDLGLANSSAKMISKGDLIYALYGATSGDVDIAKLDAAINQAILCIRPHNDDRVYLKHWLTFKRNSIISKYLQGGQGNVSAEIIKSLIVPIPILDEQRKIAALLSNVDDVIAKQQAEVAAWELRKKGVAQRLFSQEVRFKADDGSIFPAWKTLSFSKVFSRVTNNSLSWAKLIRESDSSTHHPKNIHYGDIHTRFGEVLDLAKDQVPVIKDDVDCSRLQPLQEGDVVFADAAEDDTVGKAIEVYNLGANVLYAGLHTIACRPKITFAPKYLGYYLNAASFHDQLRPYMQRTKVTSISKTNIALTYVSVPSPQEQRKIADCLYAIDEVIAKAKAELELWRELKRGLLQQLFV